LLTGHEIEKQRRRGKIIIDPWDPSQLNPNSYNLTLAPTLYFYDRLSVILDIRQPAEPTGSFTIPEEGIVLQPGYLYLGKTVEYTETHSHVPVIEGRSSIGRLGLAVHITAGYGDIGYCGNWTLELFCFVPIRIYPNIQTCQISYHRPEGRIRSTYRGKYQGARDVITSQIHQELQRESTGVVSKQTSNHRELPNHPVLP
jgi:dCTP deaminase